MATVSVCAAAAQHFVRRLQQMDRALNARDILVVCTGVTCRSNEGFILKEAVAVIKESGHSFQSWDRPVRPHPP